MKKILFIHHNASTVGAGLSAFHIVASIPREEYEVVVCMPDGKGDLCEKLENTGIRVRKDIHHSCTYTHVNGYHYNLFSISHFHNIYELVKSRKIFKRVIQEENPDIVMVNSMTLFWIGRLAQKAGAKTVCFHRESYYPGLLGLRTKYIKYRLNNDFDKIVFLSDYDMQQTGNLYSKYMKITDKVDVSLYEGLNKEDMRKELDLPNNEKLVLYVGGVSKLKGIEVALKTFKELQKEAKLIVLQYVKATDLSRGIRGLRQKFRRWEGKDIPYWTDNFIRENNMEANLILRGKTDQVEKYFVACDLVIFPSQEAHQARPVFEAGIAKRPIVISDFDNTKEFLDNSNGWCVKYDDVGMWIKTCRDILQKGTEVDKRIEMNYNKTKSGHSLKKLTQEINELLNNL